MYQSCHEKLVNHNYAAIEDSAFDKEVIIEVVVPVNTEMEFKKLNKEVEFKSIAADNQIIVGDKVDKEESANVGVLYDNGLAGNILYKEAKVEADAMQSMWDEVRIDISEIDTEGMQNEIKSVIFTKQQIIVILSAR